MIDLTPLDVRKKRGDFRRLLRGYDPEEVDTFMDLVADRFEELVRENLSLTEKNDRLESQLEALEGREKAVQDALVTAQKLREEVREETRRDAEVLKDQASRTAELLKAEAESEIKRRLAEVDADITRRLSEAESLIRERQFALEELERSRLKFLKSFRGLLEREIDAVDVEESRRPLEETPLELEFRGWMPESELEEGEDEHEHEHEQEDVDGDADADRDPWDEALAQELPKRAGPVTEVVEDVPVAGDEAPEATEAASEVAEAAPEVAESVPEVAEAVPEILEEVPDEVEETAFAAQDEEIAESTPWEDTIEAVDLPSEEEMPTPSGFETQVLPPSPHGSEPEEIREESQAPESIGLEDAETPKEPKWLFSLLKKEEEREGQG